MARQHDVELARILTRGSVIKTAVICATIITGLAIICVTAYKMTEKPSWLIVVLALLGVGGGPSLATLVVMWLRERYIKKNHQDRVKLEQMVDPTRKSSES